MQRGRRTALDVLAADPSRFPYVRITFPGKVHRRQIGCVTDLLKTLEYGKCKRAGLAVEHGMERRLLHGSKRSGMIGAKTRQQLDQSALHQRFDLPIVDLQRFTERTDRPNIVQLR
jgi:hypothetical protein